MNQGNAKKEEQTSSSNGYRYKGVVPQRNGHWGAQIYANHQRVWLGTFKTERDAAMAYDSASIKLRSSDTYRNIPASQALLAFEAEFQTHFNEEAVLAMIKEGSYQSKLGEYIRAWQAHPDPVGQLGHHFPAGVMRLRDGDGILYKDYFEKELTPSDVGKLNRLVIPKKYAVRFFPQESSHVEDVADAELDFYDTAMKRWTFRYCYWKVSQSFVFTKGWNKFVRDKGLKTKDVVLFYACETRSTAGEVNKFSLIDVRHCPPEMDGEGVAAEAQEEDGEAEAEAETTMYQGEENVEPQGERERRAFRLFGVEIM